MLKEQKNSIIAITLFFLLSFWWLVSPRFQPEVGKRFFGDFPSIYAILALYGGVSGVIISQKWGGIKSIFGKSILMFSLGLFLQVFGQLAYAYYSFYLIAEAPYPSLGDIGYFGSIPLYIYGVVLIAQAAGVKIALRSFTNKIQAILIPGIMLTVGYYLFLLNYEFDWSSPLRIFLDFGYPLTQAIYVSLAILTYTLSKNVLGGMMKKKILFILISLGIQFCSDYTFLYQISNETWVVGGINDYMYLVSYLLMTLSLLQFDTAMLRVKK